MACLFTRKCQMTSPPSWKVERSSYVNTKSSSDFPLCFNFWNVFEVSNICNYYTVTVLNDIVKNVSCAYILFARCIKYRRFKHKVESNTVRFVYFSAVHLTHTFKFHVTALFAYMNTITRGTPELHYLDVTLNPRKSHIQKNATSLLLFFLDLL